MSSGADTPQLEDGYVRVANKLFDAITRHPFSKRQYKALLYIIRKTYGYGKKTDAMSYGQIAEATGLKRQHVVVTIAELVAMNAIVSSESAVTVRGQHLNEFGIQKDSSRWLTSPKTVTSTETGLVPKQDATSPKTGRSLVPKQGPTKDNYTKDNYKRKGGSDAGASQIGISRFLDECREQGEKPVPEGHAVFALAEGMNIPAEFLRLNWLEFKDRMSNRSKRYKGITGWRRAFYNSVNEAWFGLWTFDNGECVLTRAGIQAQQKHREAMRNAA